VKNSISHSWTKKLQNKCWKLVCPCRQIVRCQDARIESIGLDGTNGLIQRVFPFHFFAVRFSSADAEAIGIALLNTLGRVPPLLLITYLLL
jgi:hypothetical protein